MKDIAKIFVYTGIYLVPCIVLIISNTLFFPFITGKNFTFRIITEIIFAAWIILALYEPKYRPKFSWIIVSFLSLLVVMFFANLFGEHPLQSFWNNFERMEGYVTLVHVFIYMIVTGSVLKTPILWDRFFNTTIVVAVILSMYAFAQLAGNIVINQGGWRLDGTLGNSAYMAIYMLFHVFITFLMFSKTKNNVLRYVYGALSLLFMYLLLQTATRGTIIGLVVGSGVTVSYIALFTQGYSKIRKIAIGGLIAIFAVVALFITFKESSFIQGNPYLQRIATISLKEAATRFDIWSMAFQGVKEHPLLGWGQSNYNYAFNKYYEPELHGQEAWFDRVHNIVMDWLIAGGVIGTLAYFSIIFAALYYLFFRPLVQKEDQAFTVIERAILIGLLAGYTIHNTFVFDNIVSYVFYGTILAYIHARVGRPFIRIEQQKVDTRIIDQMIVPVAVVVLCIVVYTVNIPAIRAAGDIIDAFRTQNPEEMLLYFDRALSRGSFGNQEIREQMTQRLQSFIQNADVSDTLKQKIYTRIEEELLKQNKEKPGDARIEVFISSFYRTTGQIEKAIEHLKVAHELSPRKQLIIYEQGFAAIQNQDYISARDFFKEAYDLGPQFAESRSFYAMSALYSGDYDLAHTLIDTEEHLQVFAQNDYAVQAAYTAKQYPILIKMLRKRVELKPDETQERSSLAFVLNETGDTTGAVEVLTQAGKDIPSFKEQADQFITSIFGEKLKNEYPPIPR